MNSTLDFDEKIVRQLDLTRVAYLRKAMQVRWLQSVYRVRAARLATNFIALSLIYLPLSLRHPEILLVLGPLVLGYPHLIASYLFVTRASDSIRTSSSERKLSPSAKLVLPLILLTGIASGVRYIQGRSFVPELASGSWEIILSLVLFLRVTFGSFFIRSRLAPQRANIQTILICATTVTVVAYILMLAAKDPLIFVAVSLVLHNWVAFAYWIVSAREHRDRRVAILATLFFALVHYLVFSGNLDFLISSSGANAIFNLGREVPSSILAPWSSEPIVWARTMVLYTFGLSLHYFIWLRAIPECLSPRELPNSWRESHRLTSHACGAMLLRILMIGALGLTGLWIFSYPVGRVIYFGLASLHGWFEFVFLIAASCQVLASMAMRQNRLSDMSPEHAQLSHSD